MHDTPHYPLRGLLKRLIEPFATGHGGRVPLGPDEWETLRRQVPFIATLTPEEAERLKGMVEELLGTREFVGIESEPTPGQCRMIAAYAALPVLELGLAPYRDWRTLVLYPDTFVPEHEWVDEDGIVHQGAMPQSGEAWERGPVILSWADVVRDGAVVVHEMTHVLDAGNGDVNGFPPLARDHSAADWTRDFTAAYEALVEAVEYDVPEDQLPLDPYAATAPEEFLAVAAEAFFFEPQGLREALPAVYDHLVRYFRQEPHRRAAAIATQGTHLPHEISA
ncbi:zinc-dependent peptidase [Thioalkalivibrio sp. HL-Eb18]|uniref:M90 family metallopeptidase n=1 Tax=Thioalkalivibrio sp. HL-Eb18 TaxID=1266913 RepID=UPI00036F58E0|nr:M90 family metallopeptidase [Thioalkalivibrio sp. HL-Eb18]